MSKAENRHNTKKWKEKRKNKLGDKCGKAKCGVCSYHKNVGNSSKLDCKKRKIENDILKFEEDNINDEENSETD